MPIFWTEKEPEDMEDRSARLSSRVDPSVSPASSAIDDATMDRIYRRIREALYPADETGMHTYNPAGVRVARIEDLPIMQKPDNNPQKRS